MHFIKYCIQGDEMRATKIFLFTILVLTQVLFPRQITFNEAQIVAENWTIDLEEKFNDQVRISDGREIYRDNIIVAYVFDLYPKGFVIISPQDYLPPIKMYSTESNFERSGGPLEDIIFKSTLKLIRAVDQGVLNKKINFSGRNKQVFKYYLEGNQKYEDISRSKSEVTQEVEPLLSTTWGQGGPYNNYCPVINGRISPTGCVATAFSQILNFHEWPVRGTGTESYYDWLIDMTISTSFEKEYKWWNMIDEYGYGTNEEDNAVASLMYDVGVALHSGYTEDDTAADSRIHLHNFVDHLLYSTDIYDVHWAKYQKLDAWFNVAKNQIDNGWPCEYGIGGTHIGHSVVIDGYRIDGNTKMLHLNFGWSGSHNGYFSMNNIFINSTYDFTEIDGQTMTLNIYPYPEYKKPAGLPPETIIAEAFLNRSVFLSEYIIHISWSESPSPDKRVEAYIIYQQKDGSIDEIDRVDPEKKIYEIRTKDLSGIQYSIGVIDKNGAISDMPAFVTPVLK